MGLLEGLLRGILGVLTIVHIPLKHIPPIVPPHIGPYKEGSLSYSLGLEFLVGTCIIKGLFSFVCYWACLRN